MRLEEVCELIEEKERQKREAEDFIDEKYEEIYELQEELDKLYEIRNELWRQERRHAHWEYERSVL